MRNVFFVCLLSLLSLILRAQNVSPETKLFLGGYDPVSYFSGKPAKGSSQLQLSYKAHQYSFQSKVNLEAFKKSPEKYLPQYGGYCAFAMADSGEKVDVNPQSFTIYQGKLYLFYKTFLTDTRSQWKKDEAGLKKKADTNWSKL